MSGRRLASLAFCCSLLAGLTGTGEVARAAEPAKTPPAVETKADNTEPRLKYIRITRDGADEPLALQTAVVHFVPAEDSSTAAAKADLRVDLVGAVHVGEKSYYDALNKAFENYDVVLYELVAPEGTRVPKGGRSSGHPIALLQNGMKDLLGLEHQLQLVDYTKENMIHADMSPEDFAKSMEEREESFIGMFARMWGQAIAQQSSQKNRTSDFDVLAALFSSDRAGTMKRVMAEQFENVEGVMQALEGPDGSTIITERNKVALKKLAEQIAAGKKKIAIFYGAGHLGDMEKRLVSDFELKRSGEDWLDAWILTSAPKAKKPAAVESEDAPSDAQPAESPKKAA
jgi:hypothetical protein